jgi:hypothetical protein
MRRRSKRVNKSRRNLRNVLPLPVHCQSLQRVRNLYHFCCYRSPRKSISAPDNSKAQKKEKNPGEVESSLLKEICPAGRGLHYKLGALLTGI